MLNRAVLILVLAGAFGWICGCSGVSHKALSQVTYTDTFAQLHADPEKVMGETVMFGGKIITTSVKGDGTELTVLQLELSNSHRPRSSDQSEGRFLIRSAQFLDPAIYPAGTLITIVGKLIGSQERNIGQMPYRYPVIEPVEIKKWSGEADTPRFHFGFGVGTSF